MVFLFILSFIVVPALFYVMLYTFINLHPWNIHMKVLRRYKKLYDNLHSLVSKGTYNLHLDSWKLNWCLYWVCVLGIVPLDSFVYLGIYGILTEACLTITIPGKYSDVPSPIDNRGRLLSTFRGMYINYLVTCTLIAIVFVSVYLTVLIRLILIMLIRS